MPNLIQQDTISVKDIVDMRKELTYFIPNAIVIRANDKEVRAIIRTANLPLVVFPWFLPPQRPSMGHSEHHRFKREVGQGALFPCTSRLTDAQPMDVEALHKATKQAKQLAAPPESSLADGAPAEIDLGPEDEFTQKMFGAAPEANVPLPADGSLFREPSAKSPVVDAVLPVSLKTAWRLFLADPSTFSMEIHTFVKDFGKQHPLTRIFFIVLCLSSPLLHQCFPLLFHSSRLYVLLT